MTTWKGNPILTLGLSADAVAKAIEEIDGRLAGPDTNLSPHNDDTQHLFDAQDALEAIITFLPAKTADDAMAQAVHAARIVVDVRDNDHEEHHQHVLARRLDRLIHSVIGYFETQGLDRDVYGADLFAPKWADPMRRLAAADPDAERHAAIAKGGKA